MNPEGKRNIALGGKLSTNLLETIENVTFNPPPPGLMEQYYKPSTRDHIQRYTGALSNLPQETIPLNNTYGRQDWLPGNFQSEY